MRKYPTNLLSRRSTHVVAAAVLVLLSTHSASAEPNLSTLTTQLDSVATAIKNYFEPISRIALYIMAIVGLIGAVAVYGKFSGGDPDTRKSITNWFGALIFAGIVLIVLRAIFL